ncbi:MAG: TlyA family RNA methyltransferase [Tissierellia bacterium]|nr:TlyA family RNA methyltransferase [Tissierellia bacterium]
MRLDIYISSQYEMSRSRAKDLIDQGAITINGKIATKAGICINSEDRIELDTVYTQYVNRAGLKLKRAIESFNIIVKDKKALDIGASKGGFTDCLLQHGACSVYAIDVGKNQFAKELKNDKRVFLFEETDIRDFDVSSHEFNIITCDVSFISLLKLEGVFQKLAVKDTELILLIKPQFELSKREVGKNGIVKNRNLRNKAIQNVCQMMTMLGYNLIGCIESPIRGKNGNTEFLSYFKL